ncbi:MAG: hypothetical protein C5B56_15630 [Proteobacteria bacterium]|nr:MAG: hypothetical protein C5B56_15630 [Pseudomonadota bacterium]
MATLAATNGTVTQNQIFWQIQTGSMLVIDIGTPQEETVVVSGVAPGNVISATFTKLHGVGSTVTIPGNPGPQPTFSITAPGFSGVVLAYTVLK